MNLAHFFYAQLQRIKDMPRSHPTESHPRKCECCQCVHMRRRDRARKAKIAYDSTRLDDRHGARRGERIGWSGSRFS